MYINILNFIFTTAHDLVNNVKAVVDALNRICMENPWFETTI